MENIKLLNLPADVLEAVQRTDANYRRHQSVGVDILDVTGQTVTVRVSQFKANCQVFEPKELIEKAKEVLSHIPSNLFAIYHFRPVTFKGEGPEMVDADWVKRRMKETGTTQAQIVSDLKSDKHVISKLLSGKYGFTTAWKAAFFYYFKK
jgi:hypothetical protein